jgi:hypothetical protein
MRWLLLLFIPCIAAASDLNGTWSVPRNEEFPGYTRAVIIDATDRLYFQYESDYGNRCEAFGIARRRADNLFVFSNKLEDRFFEHHELYGTDLNEDCEISFAQVGAMLKVRTSGNCQSFCGMRAAIGGDLQKVPSELPAAAAAAATLTPPQ